MLILYIKCILASLLGSAAHLMLKLDSTSKKAKSSKETFSSSQFLKDEKYAILGNLACQAMYILLMEEVIAGYPALENWIIATNAFVGYVGSSLFSKVFGAANKKLDKVIDEKTK